MAASLGTRNREPTMRARELRIDAVLCHPRFREARRRYIEGYLAFYSGDPALNKLMAEAARHVIVTFVICLTAASRDDDPNSWLTLGKLQDEVERHQVGSSGLVESIVSRMLDRDLLTAAPTARDRRKRILAPTAELLRLDRDILVAQAIPAEMVLPSPAMTRAVACDPQFQRAHRAFAVNAFGMAMEFFARNAEAMRFIAHDSGLMVLFSLLASAARSPGGDLSTISYQEMTDRFGISRTHARDMIEEAAGAGWVRVSEPGGAAVQLTPTLMRIADRYVADAMDFFAYCCEEAEKNLASA